MIQFNSRGYLYALEQEDAAMWKNIRMMKTPRPPAVHAAHEPAEREVVGDELDRLVRLVRIGLVVHREHDAGDRLTRKCGQRRRSGVWNQPESRGPVEEEVLHAADEAGAPSSQSSG
jgi:hypothetical protein